MMEGRAWCREELSVIINFYLLFFSYSLEVSKHLLVIFLNSQNVFPCGGVMPYSSRVLFIPPWGPGRALYIMDAQPYYQPNVRDPRRDPQI